MDSRSYLKFLPFVPLAAALFVSGCTSGAGITTGTSPNTVTAPAFVIGTDAPMASVVSFAVQINSIDAIDSSGNSVSLISGTPTVDFARFNGLQTLLDLNDVPVGTYSSINISLGSATIGYLNVPASGAPTISTETATLTTSTISVPLANPLIVATTGPVGLRLDFDLRKSIQVQNGAITGSVTPTFDVRTVQPSDSGAYVDCFDAAVVSVDAAGQSFTIQGPHGHQWTVNVNGQTSWEGTGDSLSSLTTSSIVAISGTLDRADSTFDADDVAILSDSGFYADGQLTYVYPSPTNMVPSPGATGFGLYVRGLLPTTTGINLGDIAQVDLSGNEKYSIYWWHNSLTEFLFNSNQLLPGQHISVGGPASGAANEDAVTVKRVVLRHWGFNGTVVPGSVNSGTGTFQMQISGFAGLLIPQTVTVYTAGPTKFRDGLTDLGDVSAATDIRVVGLLVKDPISGNTVLLAHYVDEQN